MEREVKAACVQFTVALGSVEANLAYVESALRRLALKGAQLAVLPEMWSCGFAYRELSRLAGETPRVLKIIGALSAELGLTVVGSLPEPHGEKVYNTAFVLDRGVVAGSYRKMHLFSLMGEDRAFDAGERYLVAETSLGKIGVMICYDLRFPELARRLTLEGASILAVPGQWPETRVEHWRTLISARAMENQLFMVATNCCGTVGKFRFCGESAVIGPRGEVLASAGGESCEVVATLNPADMARFRAEIDCLADRRPDCY